MYKFRYALLSVSKLKHIFILDIFNGGIQS